MQVQGVVQRNVMIADPNMMICGVARQMRADNVGSLSIGEHDRLIGVVTDREIAIRGVATDQLVRDAADTIAAAVHGIVAFSRRHPRDGRTD